MKPKNNFNAFGRENAFRMALEKIGADADKYGGYLLPTIQESDEDALEEIRHDIYHGGRETQSW